jgi:hypothetical protein
MPLQMDGYSRNHRQHIADGEPCSRDMRGREAADRHHGGEMIEADNGVGEA